MTTNETIDNLRRSLFKQRFVNELEYTKEDFEMYEDDEMINSRIAQLNKIIASLDDDNVKKKPVKKTQEEVYNEINKYIFKKPWNRLPEFHKVKKIKEYVDELVKDDTLKKQILKELSDKIYDKKLGTKKSVIYDHENAKITDLKALKYNKDDCTYTISE